MRRLIAPLVMLAAAGVAVAAYAVVANDSAGRADCPGRIECPPTGELVCADRCPLGAKGNNGGETLPACCRGGK